MAELLQELTDRVSRGESVLMVGGHVPRDLDTMPRWTIIRIHCDGPISTWGPMELARQRVEALLGRVGDSPDSSLDEIIQLSHRMLDSDTPEHSMSMVLVEGLNRLKRVASHRAAVIFDAVDDADRATLTSLRELVCDARLELPLIFTMREEPEGAARAFRSAFEEAFGEDAIIEVTQARESSTFRWAGLDAEAMLVARAGLIVGDVFEVRLVARLLERSEIEVLHTLQRIADAGAPLRDRGEGFLTFSPHSLRDLNEGLLPSLRSRWNHMLAEIVLEPEHEQVHGPVDEDKEGDIIAEIGPALEDDFEVPDLDAYAELFSTERRHEFGVGDEASDASTSYIESRSLDEEALLEALKVEAEEPPTAQIPTDAPGDHARAAVYLRRAGRGAEAIQHMLAAARQIAERRDPPRAMYVIESALEFVDHLPATDSARALRARAIFESARIQWSGAAVGTPYSLLEALETAEEALGTLPSDSVPKLRAEIVALIAGICYDLGDDDSLERSYSALTEASRLLQQANFPVDAARLLNEQAAVLVRFGDPVQAVHLLERSSAIFESMRQRNSGDRVAARELAQTHHLLSRMPMHAGICPGDEERAHRTGLAHAARAAMLYHELEDAREAARVWETMGRLEMSLGELDKAQDYLGRALLVQRRLSDVTGLARTSAGLSDLLLQRNEHDEALTLLAESASLNARKGSPRGLVFNLRALDEFAQSIMELPPERIEELEPRLRELDDFLGQAAEELGLIHRVVERR